MDVQFLDGEIARRRVSRLERVGETFLLVEAEQRHGPFDFADLVPLVAGPGGTASYGHRSRSGWRIDLMHAPPPDIAERLPRPARYGRWVDRIGLGRAALLFAAISAVALAVVLTVPQWLAPIVPAGVERRLGEALVGNLGGRVCHSPAGDAALARLVARLDPASGDLQVGIANFPVVNAAALPGGKIFIFRGLLNDARSPDELAGVVSHEIGHVRERHVMQALLRQLGLSIFLAGADSNVGGVLGGALSLSYGREAERAADQHAIAAMRRAAIDPADTAAFFQRMGGGTLPRETEKSEGFSFQRLEGYVSSHPLSAERRDAFLAARKAGSRYRAPLTPAEWRALQGICAGQPAARFDFFS